jgi:hypothetical protein
MYIMCHRAVLWESILIPLVLTCALSSICGCAPYSEEEPSQWQTYGGSETKTNPIESADFENSVEELMAGLEEFPVAKPPFTKGMYPCTTCHSVLKDNFMRRELTKDHTDIKLDHGPPERWCFDCHIQNNLGKLRLVSGTTVRFTESYLLCGQCHGPKLRDWRVGVHGQRTGDWNGQKQYLLCVHCHDPHSPRFKSLVPEPPPQRPAAIQQVGLFNR